MSFRSRSDSREREAWSTGTSRKWESRLIGSTPFAACPAKLPPRRISGARSSLASRLSTKLLRTRFALITGLQADFRTPWIDDGSTNMERCTLRVPSSTFRAASPFTGRPTRQQSIRSFHDYFVTHLPSSSLHPDSRSAAGPRHQLPRSASKPHPAPGSSPNEAPSPSPTPARLVGGSLTRDTTVVRIPLRSAKHHFGVSLNRGQRAYNEDYFQAGVIEIPAFARRAPISLTTRAPPSSPLQAYREKQRRERERQENGNAGEKEEATAASGASGDPQVFYFGVFDGHGGTECSEFLKESLHGYIEEAAQSFELGSTLKGQIAPQSQGPSVKPSTSVLTSSGLESNGFAKIEKRGMHEASHGVLPNSPVLGHPPLPQRVNTGRALEMENSLLQRWRDLVGGYFRRFKPTLFSADSSSDTSTVLTYAFLQADFDFVSAQARKTETEADPVLADAPLNAGDILHSPATRIGGPKRFRGGSTCSVALVSTPSPVPFWHPSTPASLLAAHVGDSRIILCRTVDGAALPVTADHHPNNPCEGRRLRRYAGSFVTDSFGEERLSGLANTRAFGDMGSKRLGVSAEPEVRRVEMAAAEYAFLVLVSDGVSGVLEDQEVVDIVKEARTPEQGARDVVAFATEVTSEGDNATCVCVRLGGWERRSEGGLGSLGTKEKRDYRRQEALQPRGRRD